MGGAVSAGVDNDDLTDNLRQADYIHTTLVERVFRAVDRGEYILPEFRMSAYKDQAWRCNHLHLSAPCIYSEVMEALALAPGISFLNLGSGTGYLSTMAGLILGSNGINHGVEFYDDVITYAYKKLEEFKKYSGAIDEFDFCEPKFMQGNCLCLTNERRYDRVYVGAACPEPFDMYMMQLLCVGGTLVMPFNEQLLKVKRTSEHTWDSATLLSVSFANLILPLEGCKETLDLIELEPLPLQALCRSLIRNILRENIEVEMPDLKNRKQATAATQKRTRTPYVKNVVYETNDTESEQDVREYLGLVFDRVVGDRPVRMNRRRVNRNCFNWLTDAEYETDSTDDFNMETSNQNADNGNNEAQSSTAENVEMMDTTGGNAETSSSGTKTQEEKQGRQKFDSGLGDESQSDDMLSNHDEEENKDEPKAEDKERKTYAWQVYEDNSSLSTSDNEEYEDMATPDLNERRTIDSPYTQHMSNKIQQLPLPPILKDYLNFYRI